MTSALLLVGLLSVPTQAHAAEGPVNLGTAGTYSVLGGSTVTNTGASRLSGDVGVSPGTAITGFSRGTVGGTTHAADAAALQAQADLTTAYNDAASRKPTATVTGNLGGRTFTAGVYHSASSLAVSGTLTLDGQGNPNAVFIFQMASTLTTAASKVTMINGAQAGHVFWQVGSSATVGASSSLAGTIIASTSITVNTSATVKGRALARKGAVILDNDTFMPVAHTPAVPGSSSPAVPGTSSPAVPSTSSPAVPSTSSPAVTRTSTRAVPGTSTRAVPGTSSPAVTSTVTPSVINTVTPSMPGTFDPAVPGTFAPAADGTLSITVPAGPVALGSVAASASAQQVSGQLGLVTVTDSRDGAAGWTATAGATDFAGPQSISVSATGSSVYVTPSATVTGTAAVIASNLSPLFPSGPVQIATGVNPTNTASWNPAITVTIPAGALAGTYSTTITHSVI